MELPGIRRITTPLPTRPGHVHSYLLPGEDGWTLVDTGIGLPNAQEVWSDSLAGGSRPDLRHPLPPRSRRRRRGRRRADARTGAPGRARLCAVRARLGEPELAGADRGLVSHARRPGRDHGGADRLRRRLPALHPLPARPDPARRRRPARRLGACRRARARRRPALPAEGPRARLADHLLGRISPTVGLAGQPADPLGDFLESLERTIEPEPKIALPGHGDPIEDPVGRARELIEHHHERLAFAEATLTDTPRSGYEVSFDLFGADLKPASRRFAVAETLSTSSGSCSRSARNGSRMTDRCLYCAPA